jgi:hypothetical protein
MELTVDGRCAGPVDPTYACIPTGINRYMHEFQNRPTKGYLDCPGCARRGRGARGTREARRGRPRTGKGRLGWRAAGPSAGNVACSCGYRSETGCAAYDGRGALSRCGVVAAFAGARLDRRRNSKCGRPVGGPGEGGGSPEVPGVVDLRRAFASSVAVWHSAVFGERPGRVSYF